MLLRPRNFRDVAGLQVTARNRENLLVFMILDMVSVSVGFIAADASHLK